MITIECTTKEYHALLKVMDNSSECIFEDNPDVKCTMDYTNYSDGEEELTCASCLKSNIIWIIED